MEIMEIWTDSTTKYGRFEMLNSWRLICVDIFLTANTHVRCN
jgi:hypothetical protein